MNTAADAFAAGELTTAVDLQRATVGNRPADAAARLFLAELLVLTGEHRAAWAELKRIESADPAWPAERRRFGRLVRAAFRRERGTSPRFLTDAPPHALFRVRSRRAVRGHDFPKATRFVDRADSTTPTVMGHIDGREFHALRDADDTLAGVLELIVRGENIWLPWEHLRRLTLDPPRHPLCVALRPATVRLGDDRTFRCHVPLLYAGSAAAGPDFALGRETGIAGERGPAVGIGAKQLFTDDADAMLNETRQIDVRAWV